MTTYPAKTLLRYFPSLDSAAHYTAVVLADGRIYQIKSPSNEHIHLNSVDDWLHSLPGFPTTESLVVSTQKEERKKNEKPKKKKFNVPSKYQSKYTPLKWGRNIYYSMKQFAPSLLEREDVIDLYNSFIEVLSVHHPNIYISITGGANMLMRGISMEGHTGIPVYYTFMHARSTAMYGTTEKKEKKEENEKIIEGYRAAYMPLYDAIKRDIVPVIDRFKADYIANSTIKYANNRITKLIQKQIMLQARFNHSMKVLEREVQSCKDTIYKCENRVPKKYEWDLVTAVIAAPSVVPSVTPSVTPSILPCPVCAKSTCSSTCTC